MNETGIISSTENKITNLIQLLLTFNKKITFEPVKDNLNLQTPVYIFNFCLLTVRAK